MKVNNPNITHKFVWEYIEQHNDSWGINHYVAALETVGYILFTHNGVSEYLKDLNPPQLAKLYNELRKIPTN